VESRQCHDRRLLIREPQRAPRSRHLHPQVNYLPPGFTTMQHSTSAPPSPSHRHGHQTPSRMPVSQTPSPYLSPQPSGFMQPYLGVTRRRLLIPTVRRSSDGNSPKFGSKPASRLARSTSGSASHHSSPDPGSIQRPPTLVGKEWIGAECRFEVLEEFELDGYQIYAVEKWFVVPWLLPTP
jgi:hypothetical protein